MQGTESDRYIKTENMQNMLIMLMRAQGHFTQGIDTEGCINAEFSVVTSGERKGQ